MKKLYILVFALATILLSLIVWLWTNREPTIPHYPNAELVNETPYQRTQSVGARIKTLTLQSNDPPNIVRQWYKTYLDQDWYDIYDGPMLDTDLTYGNKSFNDGESGYSIGVNIRANGTGSMIIIKLAKK